MAGELFGTNESDRRLRGLVSIGGDESDHGVSLTTTLTRQTSVERVSARCAAATATCHRGRGGHWANLQATRSPRQPATRCDVLLQLYAPRGRSGLRAIRSVQTGSRPHSLPSDGRSNAGIIPPPAPSARRGRVGWLGRSARVGATLNCTTRRRWVPPLPLLPLPLPRRCFRRFTFRSPGWSTARCLAKRCW
jgi:hypothetical protein